MGLYHYHKCIWTPTECPQKKHTIQTSIIIRERKRKTKQTKENGKKKKTERDAQPALKTTTTKTEKTFGDTHRVNSKPKYVKNKVQNQKAIDKTASKCQTRRHDAQQHACFGAYTSIICRLQTRKLASIVCSDEQVDLFCILQASTGTCVCHTQTRGKSSQK